MGKAKEMFMYQRLQESLEQPRNVVYPNLKVNENRKKVKKAKGSVKRPF